MPQLPGLTLLATNLAILSTFFAARGYDRGKCSASRPIAMLPPLAASRQWLGGKCASRVRRRSGAGGTARNLISMLKRRLGGNGSSMRSGPSYTRTAVVEPRTIYWHPIAGLTPFTTEPASNARRRPRRQSFARRWPQGDNQSSTRRSAMTSKCLTLCVTNVRLFAMAVEAMSRSIS